jgi:ATP-dependent Clp protease ATP-binding subunit ClpB
LGNPKMGFARALSSVAAGSSGVAAEAVVPMGEAVDKQRNKVGAEAARRKFTPEFMNRLDKVVVFKNLGEKELKRILDIELAIFQQRILASAMQKKFVFTVGAEAKAFMLDQGVDARYGARHLKRSMERLLVQPLSNLLATDQINNGDWIRIELNPEEGCLTFAKEAEGLPIATLYELIDTTVPIQLAALAAAVSQEPPRMSQVRQQQQGLKNRF